MPWRTSYAMKLPLAAACPILRVGVMHCLTMCSNLVCARHGQLISAKANMKSIFTLSLVAVHVNSDCVCHVWRRVCRCAQHQRLCNPSR